MRDGNLSSSSGLSLGQKFFAVLLTLAVGGGVYSWFRHTAAQSTSSAEMAFDPRAARRFDPGLVTASEPAVALAQSILTDQVVAGLAKPAYLSSSAITSRVGEFRSRLELTQPSPRTLRVQFQDVDPGKAADTANAVASALAAWSPSLTAPPAAVAVSQPASQAVAPVPVPVPTKRPVVAHRAQAASGLAASLGELEEQLSSTNRKVDGLNAGGSSRGHSYAQSEQQHLLKSAVRGAEKQVADLRVRYADSGAGTKGRLVEIEQAVAAILPGGSAAGVDASQLRRERAQLARAIDVVQTQRRAVERDASTSASSTPEESAEASTPGVQESNLGTSSPSAASAAPDASPASAAPSSPSSASTAAAAAPIAASAPGDSTLQNPLSVARVAGPAAPIVWWPAVAAGVLCGLLYLIVAALRNRSPEAEVDYAEETPRSSGRFITPDGPSVAAERFESRVESAPVETSSFKRASFSYDPGPVGRASVEERPEAAVSDVESVAETQEEVSSPAKVVDIGDPWDSWADGMKQALSETRIGRMFEAPADREESAGTNQGSQGSRSSRSDRLAG
jgi:hypothetical protein